MKAQQQNNFVDEILGAVKKFQVLKISSNSFYQRNTLQLYFSNKVTKVYNNQQLNYNSSYSCSHKFIAQMFNNLSNSKYFECQMYDQQCQKNLLNQQFVTNKNKFILRKYLNIESISSLTTSPVTCLKNYNKRNNTYLVAIQKYKFVLDKKHLEFWKNITRQSIYGKINVSIIQLVNNTNIFRNKVVYHKNIQWKTTNVTIEVIVTQCYRTYFQKYLKAIKCYKI
eukprot:TRINITY_DN24976_c0_g1_i2.p1 TRINITY_DN24976_c0_g1~~TRINITY_DN24976_c0_g1_i2.p1  ORF type:complete len:225 (+),score=-11.92 TRINITY_DN24976_c0_g1_i2:212-886(+)